MKHHHSVLAAIDDKLSVWREIKAQLEAIERTAAKRRAVLEQVNTILAEWEPLAAHAAELEQYDGQS